MKVFKYVLEVSDRQTILMPLGAGILSVAIQDEKVCLWALVNESANHECRSFAIHGTGHEVTDVESKTFLGTVLMYGGSLVFHVFEIDE